MPPRVRYDRKHKNSWTHMFTRKSILLVFAIVIITALFFGQVPEKSIVYEGLKGPTERTEMTPIPDSKLSQYNNQDINALAVLITDINSNWLGLAHGLKTIGVPFRLTENIDAALKHDVVMVYPVISGRVMTAENLKRLARYPQTGGVLIGSNVLGGGLQSVFGFEYLEESKSKTKITFASGEPLTEKLINLGQGEIKIGSETKVSTNPGTNAYINPNGLTLAKYEDGSAAITGRLFENGAAFALGIDLGQLILKGHNFSEVDISTSYVNQYQPTLDSLLILIRELYKYGEPDAVTLGTVPDGKSLSVLMTHDVDYKKSLKNAVKYARMEKGLGIRSTYFIQSKYTHDYNDTSFFDDEGTAYIKEVKTLGMEIASHSVSHSLQFDSFDLGSGNEIYPNYQPRVRSRSRTSGATLMGELRVSKFILENQIDGSTVTAFRPGYLRIPRKLPEALMWSGYKYSSSVTANKSLTHLPFQSMKSRGYKNEVDIFEFPVTVDDETLPRMDKRLPDAIRLADTLAQYGGLFVVLSHPDVLSYKYKFAEGFINHTKAYAWFGSVSDFGDWWSARNSLEIKIESKEGQKYLSISCPKDIKGLTLNVPKNYNFDADEENIKSQNAHKWIVNCFEGHASFKVFD